MSNTTSNDMMSLPSSGGESEKSQGSSKGETSICTVSSDDEAQAGGQQGVRRSTRKRVQRGPRDQELVAGFLSGGRVRKARNTKASSAMRAPINGKAAKMGGGKEYRVQGLDGVRHQLGQPIEFKVNWERTWVPFHALRGEELFEEARGVIKETLGYSTWEAEDGPRSHEEALDLNEEVEYDSE